MSVVKFLPAAAEDTSEVVLEKAVWVLPESNLDDCYACLNVTREATQQEIKQAFRRIVLQVHPDRCVRNDIHAPTVYAKVCEAYEILVNPLLRAVYDAFGREGVEKGLPRPASATGALKQDPPSVRVNDVDVTEFRGYKYHCNPDRTFKEFFGTASVFAEILSARQYDMQSGTRSYGLHSLTCEPRRSPAEYVNIEFTLEELFGGTVRRFSRKRRLHRPNAAKARVPKHQGNRSSGFEYEIVEHVIAVQPGTEAGTTYTFAEHGDEGPNVIPADIVYVVQEQRHPVFSRPLRSQATPDVTPGLLVHRAEVPLTSALKGAKVDITTLDGRKLVVIVPGVVGPDQKFVVPNEGMPLLPRDPAMAAAASSAATCASTMQRAIAPGGCDNRFANVATGPRGDLHIVFSIVFPKYLSLTQKTKIDRLLDNHK